MKICIRKWKWKQRKIRIYGTQVPCGFLTWELNKTIRNWKPQNIFRSISLFSNVYFLSEYFKFWEKIVPYKVVSFVESRRPLFVIFQTKFNWMFKHSFFEWESISKREMKEGFQVKCTTLRTGKRMWERMLDLYSSSCSTLTPSFTLLLLALCNHINKFPYHNDALFSNNRGKNSSPWLV